MYDKVSNKNLPPCVTSYACKMGACDINHYCIPPHLRNFSRSSSQDDAVTMQKNEGFPELLGEPASKLWGNSQGESRMGSAIWGQSQVRLWNWFWGTEECQVHGCEFSAPPPGMNFPN